MNKTKLTKHVPIWERTEAGRILVWKGKHGNEYWLADTPERFKAAFLAMFEAVDSCQYYFFEDQEDTLKEIRAIEKKMSLLSSDLTLIDQRDRDHLAQLKKNLSVDQEDEALYQKATAGDWKAAYNLVSRRGSCEYEEWELISAMDPLEDTSTL